MKQKLTETGLGSPLATFKKKKVASEFLLTQLTDIKFTSGPENLKTWLKEALGKISQDELRELLANSASREKDDKGKYYENIATCTIYEEIGTKERMFSTQSFPNGRNSRQCAEVLVALRLKKGYEHNQSYSISTDTDLSFDNWGETKEEICFEEAGEVEASLFPRSRDNPLCFDKQHFPDICDITEHLFVLDGPRDQLGMQSFLEDILFKPKVRDGIHKVIIFTDHLNLVSGHMNLTGFIFDYIKESTYEQVLVQDKVYLKLKDPDKAYHKTENPWYLMWGMKKKEINPVEFKIDTTKIDTKKPLYTQLSGEPLVKIMSFVEESRIPYQFSVEIESEKGLSKEDVDSVSSSGQVKTFHIKSLIEGKTEQLKVLFLREDDKNLKLRKDVLLSFYEDAQKENVLIQGNHPEYLLLLFEFLRNYDAIFNATKLESAKAKIEEIINHLQKKLLPLVPDKEVIRRSLADAKRLQEYKLTMHQAPVSTPSLIGSSPK
jgi:hypothetical protein